MSLEPRGLLNALGARVKIANGGVIMNRRDAILMFVLSAIADDYENFDTVIKNVKDLGAQCGLAMDPSEVADALASLIEAQLAKAYRLAARNTVEEIHGMPGPDALQGWQHSFMATEDGRGRLLANPVLNGEGLLQKDWPALEL